MHTKHGFKEKLKYIRMLEEGYTIDYIRRKYGINDTHLNVLWINYRRYGSSALIDKPTNKKTPPHIQLDAVYDYIKNHLSLIEICVKYDISKNTILRWKSKYDKFGVDAFVMSNNQISMGRPRKKKPEEMTELERLRYENECLRAENALLKKVKALVEAREARLKEIGQKPSKN